MHRQKCKQYKKNNTKFTTIANNLKIVLFFGMFWSNSHIGQKSRAYREQGIHFKCISQEPAWRAGNTFNPVI